MKGRVTLTVCVALAALLLAAGHAGAATNPWTAVGTPAPSAGSCGKQGDGSVRSSGVHDVLRIGTDLYVAGCFTNWAGIPEADYIAKWNGSAWSALGSNGAGNGALDKVVYDIVEYNGNLAVGGEFTDAGGVADADMVAIWTGAAWSALPVAAGVSPRNGPTDYVSALLADTTTLYVGGSFPNGIGAVTPVSNTANFAAWNGSAWVAGANATPYATYPQSQMVPQAILKHSTNIYVGAAYYGYVTCNSSCVSARMPTAFQVLSNAGTWSMPGGWSAVFGAGAFGSGIGIFALAKSGATLYVGGNFENAGGYATADYLAYFTPAGPSWGSVSSFAPSYGTGAVISDLQMTSNTLYVAGSFPSASPRGGSGVVVLDVITWQGMGSAPVGSNPLAIAYAVDYDAVNDQVYVGGPFADAGGVAAADYLVRFQQSPTSGFGARADTGYPDYTPIATLAPDGDGIYAFYDAFQTATAQCDRAYTVLPDDLGEAIEYQFDGGSWQGITDNRITVSQFVNTVAPGSPVTITIRSRSSDFTFVQTRTLRVVCTRSQTLTFGAIADQSMTTGFLALSASATSSLAATFASSTPLVCTVAGATVTFLAAGTCSVTATQAGDATWAPAADVTRSFQIAAAPAPSGESPRNDSASPPASTTSSVGSTSAKAAPASPVLGNVAVKRRVATVSFVMAAGTTYAIRATSGKKAKSGTCSARGDKGSCRVKLGKGTWLLAVTPTSSGVTGVPGTKSVKVK